MDNTKNDSKKNIIKKTAVYLFMICMLCFATACRTGDVPVNDNTVTDQQFDDAGKNDISGEADIQLPTAEPAVTDALEPTAEPDSEPADTGTTEPTAEPDSEPGTTDVTEPTTNPAVTDAPEPATDPDVTDSPQPTADPDATDVPEPASDPETTDVPDPADDTDMIPRESETVTWNEDWEFASNSKIHSDSVTLYRSMSEDRKNIVIAVNAGHGTEGGSNVKTLCHPDGSKKVTGGSTGAGETYATAVSYGTTFMDGTSEAKANLSLALILKDMLLENGYDVLMIRESSDVQLDNIARTVFANNNADCHIAIHYDSTETDKGFFYIGVPDVASYRAMEPVASWWRVHNAFGEALLQGMKDTGNKICGSGNIPLDLTQTSYSTVPSMDVEVGDRKSDYSEETQRKIAEGLLRGLNIYFDN